ncbi:hypothetical protein [Alysiella crassa]|nr:hypothetical protein [Alysiella crassa]
MDDKQIQILVHNTQTAIVLPLQNRYIIPILRPSTTHGTHHA